MNITIDVNTMVIAAAYRDVFGVNRTKRNRTTIHPPSAPMATPRASGDVRDSARHNVTPASTAKIVVANITTAPLTFFHDVLVRMTPTTASNATAATGAREFRLK